MSDYILQAKNLRKEFGSLIAVRDVSINVERGHLHSIIGPNGAGKTTLFNLLSGNLRPTSGELWYNGKNITRLPLHRRAHIGIGRSFQITNIFPTRTVFENVRLAAQARNRDLKAVFTVWGRMTSLELRAFEAIDIAQLTGKERMLASALAHGDQRKLELAMIVAADPELMLLDEPTAGMATEQVPEVIQTIDHIRQQGHRTVMLVEHNMSVVMSVSDRITVMHHGSVLAEGTPKEISESHEVQQAYLGELYSDLMESARDG
ncbi:MAG: ABC transporter ATP-binding protein [Phototrophicales bacterium]|nr:MAG: ABC transporter ATP-binding protein [Phototrophicales bacterium]